MKPMLHHGDCLDVLKTLPADSLDSVVTDPPYGISFLSADWDHGVPGPQFWKEVLRVAKPGAFMLAFGGCYDADTEVLTRRGWIRFPDVQKEDEFASLDPDTELVEFQRAVEIVELIHDGPMHRYETNRVDLLVTPNHKMFVAPLGRNPKGAWRLLASDDVPKAVRMHKSSNGLKDVRKCSMFTFPGAARRKNARGGGRKNLPSLDIPAEIWAAFLGIWLAEGHASSSFGKKGGRSTHVALTHFDSDNVLEMAGMLAPYFNVRLYPKSGRLRINDPRLYEHLSQLGQAGTKRMPEYVKSWSVDLLRILLDWYARGDGDDEGRLYTASKSLADDVQEVAMYAGLAADISIRPPKDGKINGRRIRANYPQYVVRLLTVQTRPEVYARHGRLADVPRLIVSREEWACQKVYCVELPRHHILYVRRGGKAVWCGNTRTFHRLACAIEDAGWDIRDCIMWVYGSGMPKSLDVSKAIDKAAGAKRKVIGKAADFALDGSKRKTDESHMRPHEEQGGHGYGDRWSADVTAPETEDAKKWHGWGTALKPAWEPILVCRKPLEGTVTQNILKHGTGAMNIDGCRIEYESNSRLLKGGSYGGNRSGAAGNSIFGTGGKEVSYEGTLPSGRWPANLILTYPEDCYMLRDDVMPDQLYRLAEWMKSTNENTVQGNAPVKIDEKTYMAMPTELQRLFYKCPNPDKNEVLELFPDRKTTWVSKDHQNNRNGDFLGSMGHPGEQGYNDSGSAARFFYCAKASQADRDEGMEDAELKVSDPYAQHRGRRMPNGSKRIDGKPAKMGKNNHPTVKPTALMRYLCRLVTPSGGVVLDPFMGSGSTGKAAMLEGLGFIGIEKEAEYVEIAKKRVREDPFS